MLNEVVKCLYDKTDNFYNYVQKNIESGEPVGEEILSNLWVFIYVIDYMNSKALFCLFVKYSDVVISRYEKQMSLLTRKNTCLDNNIRQNFEDVLYSSKEFVDTEIKKWYKYDFPEYYFYLGQSGWNRFGIFSFIPLYKEVKWNAVVIDKYKDLIVWPLFFEYVDYELTESFLANYQQYIPVMYYSRVCGRFFPFEYNVDAIMCNVKLTNFKNIGKLSDTFIKTYISIIDVWSLCSEGCFELTRELFDIFHRNCHENLIHDFRGEQSGSRGGLSYNKRITISSDVLLYIAKDLKYSNWEKLLHKINLTSDSFIDFYRCSPKCMEVLFDLDFNSRRTIASYIVQNDVLQKAIDIDFIKQLWQGGKTSTVYFDFIKSKGRAITWQAKEDLGRLPYTYDFSIELIQQNILLWNKQCIEYYSHMQRTPDTNYHYYKKMTLWDLLSRQESILLTYDLCKYLMSIDVQIGGSYTLEDGHYRAEEKDNFNINALLLFRFRDVADEKELLRIARDINMLDFLFANAESPTLYREDYIVGNIIDKLIMIFFEDFPFDKFKEAIEINNSRRNSMLCPNS